MWLLSVWNFKKVILAVIKQLRNRTPKRKLNVKHLAIKCKAVKEIRKGLSGKDASLKYGVQKNTILIWVKNKEKYLQALDARGRGEVKKLRETDFDKLDHVVFCWLIPKVAKIFQLME